MDSRRLHYFVAVAEELHFGRAATRLHMAQQPLSAQIQMLERELDCKLFDRSANRTCLTWAGEVLLHEARAILNRMAQADELTRRAARGELGTVRVGFSSEALKHVIPTVSRHFKNRYPTLGMQLRELSRADQLEALEVGTLDVGFLYREKVDEGCFAMINVHEDRFTVALHIKSRLAREQSISPRSLADIPYIRVSAEANPFARVIKDVLHRNDVAFAHDYEEADKLSALAQVSNGKGFTLLPELSAVEFPQVVFRHFDVPLRVQLAAIWSRRSAPSIIRDRFVEVLRLLSSGHI